MGIYAGRKTPQWFRIHTNRIFRILDSEEDQEKDDMIRRGIRIPFPIAERNVCNCNEWRKIVRTAMGKLK